MIYLEIIDKELKDMVVFDTVEEKDKWIILNKIEKELNNEEPITIIKEGDFNNWLRKRRPNLVDYENQIQKLERTKQLQKRKIELENELKQIETELNNIDSPSNLDLDNSVLNSIDNFNLDDKKESIFE